MAWMISAGEVMRSKLIFPSIDGLETYVSNRIPPVRLDTGNTDKNTLSSNVSFSCGGSVSQMDPGTNMLTMRGPNSLTVHQYRKSDPNTARMKGFGGNAFVLPGTAEETRMIPLHFSG